MSKRIRCAIYTRKSTEEGLEQDFNSLDAQRESCEAYIHSQRGLGWIVRKKRYDDGGLSGGTMERPALQSLLADIDSGKVDLIVVYKVDRLTTVRDVAREDKIDEGDVSRFLPLAFLAPDIVEAILNGKQPLELTPERLKRLRTLPESWEEQRQLLGFTG